MPTEPNETSDARWDDQLAEWIVGKYVLVGITFLKPQSTEVERQVQVHGTIVSATKGKNILLDCRGSRSGKMFRLPPDTAAFGPGSKQVYRLRTTGEEVDSPDAIATWEVAAGGQQFEDIE